MNITSEFDEIKIILDKQRKLKSEINKNNRKLKTLHKKYLFIHYILLDVHSDFLEENIKVLLKEVGFKNVNKVGKHLRKEDIRIILNNKIILIEVTGTVKGSVKDGKTSQMVKHVNTRKANNENAFGLFVINHQNSLRLKKRNKHPFTKEQIKYAEVGSYSMITTMELVKGFLLVKKGKITLEEFENKICTYGLVEFK